jgi:transcriptional regulator with XRE-family HTH domain
MRRRTAVGELLRQARLDAGLSLRALGDRASTSAATLATYEAGRKEPRISTLQRLVDATGGALVLEVQGLHRRWPSAQATAGAITAALRDSDERQALRTALDFLDRIRGADPREHVDLVTAPAPLCGDTRFDALIAAIVEDECATAGVLIPAWTSEAERFVRPFWFVSGIPDLHASALAHTPIAYARHGVFTAEDELSRV